MDLIDRQPEERANKRAETHACDLISRQAALKIVAKHIGVDGDRACLIDVGKTYGEIYALPSAQSERKKGRWIMHEGGKFIGFPYIHYECDQCRNFEPTETNYCPHCGAYMGGVNRD